MAKEPKAPGLKYDELVERLETVVEQLEAGELSLEDSLEKFSEGVKLVEKGEELLREAEKRIDQLLSKEGKTAPLDKRSKPEVSDEEDAPF